MKTTRTADYLLSRHALPTKESTPPYAGGIALQAEEVPALPAYQWPTHAAVPWPRGAIHGRYFRLGVFEDGREIPSQEADAQTWDMHGVDLRWSHVHFVWTKGRSYTIRGMSRAVPVPRPVHPIKITDSPAGITVETGTVKAVVSKQSFALFDEMYFDPGGKGKYKRKILSGSLGAEILDGGTTFATRFDSQATVELEVQGPLHAVIKAEGVYRDSGGAASEWASFTTRIHFWAGQEWIRVVHNLGYREDMSGREYGRAAILMPFNFAERFSFAADGNGAAHKGDFSGFGGADLYLHQEKHDSYRFGTDANLTAHQPVATGTRSGNCWAIQGGADKVRVECYLRSGWQEFPFEAMAGRSGTGFSMQPWHGYEAFGPLTNDAHTGEQHIHKLRYAHTGPKQRQGLPAQYVDAFNAIDKANVDAGRGTQLAETSADDAASANWQGMMIRQDLYLRVARDSAASGAAFDTGHMVHRARLVQARPIAIPDPTHVRDSFVFGPIGTIEDGYSEVFDFVTDIIKGDYNPERGGYYGRFRWGALPDRWEIMLNRPNWHRLEYGDSHYDRIALGFWYYMATGDTELLSVARKAVKFHQCFRYVNYAPSTSLANHSLMKQWHKGLTPCAGILPADASSASSRSGHSVHAYSMLAGWLIDADLDLRDAYRRWSDRSNHITVGRDRDCNNNVHEAIQQYEFFHDRAMKGPINAMRTALIAGPMSGPANVRDWDKAWPLYLDIFGGHGVRPFFENEASAGQWLSGQIDSFAHMALCYRVTGDRTFLERALKPLRSRALRGIFRAASGQYSPAFWMNTYYQPELHKTLLHFLYYLREAGIAIPEDDGEPGQYPVGATSDNNIIDLKNRGLWIAIHNPTGKRLTLQIRLYGGYPAGVSLYDPSGTELLQTLAPDVVAYDSSDGVEQVRASGWQEIVRQVSIPAGPAGRYDLYLGSNLAAQFLPTTAEHLLECGVIRNAYRVSAVAKEREYRAMVTKMYLLPKTKLHQIEWTFTPFDSLNGCRIRVHDANDTLIADAYLLRKEPGHEAVTLRMNGPGDPPAPWRIDCGPVYVMEAASASAFSAGIQNLALIGPTLSDLYAVESLSLIP